MKFMHKTAIVAALAAAATVPAHADLVTNGGFETGDFTGWTQSGNTDFTNVFNLTVFPVHSGTFTAAMGPVGSDGFLTQILPTAAGSTYQLTYWLRNEPAQPDAPNTPNDFSASIDGTILSSLVDAPGQDYTQYSFLFTAAGNDTLQFAFRQDPAFWNLDDVSVTAAVVPEPGVLALLGLGLAGLLAFRRKA